MHSLGFACDGDSEDSTLIIKQVGKVAALKKLVDEQQIDFDKTFISHCGMVSNKSIYQRGRGVLATRAKKRHHVGFFSLIHLFGFV
jgi:glucosamine--fructose-6-phosphate aminotransferase (isomerizing)